MNSLVIFFTDTDAEKRFGKLFSGYQCHWLPLHDQIRPAGSKGDVKFPRRIEQARGHACISVFILDRHSLEDHCCRKFLADQASKNPAALCLLEDHCNSGNFESTELIGLFHDFALWSCSREELQARIQRLAADRITGAPGGAAERALLRRFLNLNMAGCSSAFVDTARLIERVSNCRAPLLVSGETGTGKENAARAVHYLGPRRDKAFIPINCGAIPEELFESELFGYQQGAFTGARGNKKGLVEVASGGTLFLDELDSLSLKSQAALLRFLQFQEYRPLGSETSYSADLRIIAATNADLPAALARQEFREDLLFRINVLNIHMPPLRERPEDIPIIAAQLMQRFNAEHGAIGQLPKRLTSRAQKWLGRQPWPGNIRELENFLLRQFLLADGPWLDLTEGEGQVGEESETAGEGESLPNFQEAKARAIRDFEQDYLRSLMQLAGGNVSEAARISGKERSALGKLIRKHAIDKFAYADS